MYNVVGVGNDGDEAGLLLLLRDIDDGGVCDATKATDLGVVAVVVPSTTSTTKEETTKQDTNSTN